MVGKRNISLYSDQDAIPFYKSVGFKLGENPSDVYFATFKPKLDILEGMLDLIEIYYILRIPIQCNIFPKG